MNRILKNLPTSFLEDIRDKSYVSYIRPLVERSSYRDLTSAEQKQLKALRDINTMVSMEIHNRHHGKFKK